MRAASLIFPKDCKGDALQAPQCTRAGLVTSGVIASCKPWWRRWRRTPTLPYDEDDVDRIGKMKRGNRWWALRREEKGEWKTLIRSSRFIALGNWNHNLFFSQDSFLSSVLKMGFIYFS